MFNNKKFVLFLSIIFLFNFYICFSNNYYADLEIDIFEDGYVKIESITNYPDLKNITYSNKFTSKNGDMWIFNLTTNTIFEDFIFKLNLPDNIEINYIKTTPNIRIEHYDNQLSVIGLGENRKLNILMQYQIDKELNIKENNYLFFSLIFILLIIIFVLFFFYIVYKKNNNRFVNNKINNDILEYKNLSKRQKEIMNIIKKEKKITQKELVNILKIPKSSISRNINSLVSKNILKKEKDGISTYISLKD